jgi:phosphatidylglycerol:prolipoprotein diacylglycerol transferase
MYPNLHFVFKKLFNWDAPMLFTAIQTYGFFLALTFVVAAIIVYRELKRKYEEGLIKEAQTTVNPQVDVIINAVIGFIFGFKILYIILNYSAFINNPQEIVFSGNGSWIGGFLLAGVMAGSKILDIRKNNLKKTVVHKKPHELIGDIVVVAAIFGLLGSKILAIIEPEAWAEFVKDPMGTFFSGSGIAVYGGLLGGFISVFIYARSKKINVLHLMDAAAPALLLGYGVGRMGCHFSGDGDWGIVNSAAKPFSWLPDWAWSYTYPNNVNHVGVPIEGCEGLFYTDKYCFELPNGVYPTSVYETTMMVICFLILWSVRKRIKIWGILFSMYLIINGVERFMIEKIRVNERYEGAFDFSQAQMVSIGFVLAGLITAFVFWKQHEKRMTTASLDE